jgi:hypothetical protein
MPSWRPVFPGSFREDREVEIEFYSGSWPESIRLD